MELDVSEDSAPPDSLCQQALKRMQVPVVSAQYIDVGQKPSAARLFMQPELTLPAIPCRKHAMACSRNLELVEPAKKTPLCRNLMLWYIKPTQLKRDTHIEYDDIP